MPVLIMICPALLSMFGFGLLYGLYMHLFTGPGYHHGAGISYPGWWKPWRPFGWHVWHPYRSHYHRPFVVVHIHRVVHAHKIYTPYRSSSVVVRNRHSASVNNYRVTRSRTSITGPRGKTTTVKKTTVTGPRGNKATKVKVRRH